MYIVYKGGWFKHSAWSTEAEAAHQVEVLKDQGYRNCYCDYFEGLQVENGRYYV